MKIVVYDGSASAFKQVIETFHDAYIETRSNEVLVIKDGGDEVLFCGKMDRFYAVAYDEE